ncbi:hypothetical protein [Mycobacterium colombiense]|uniref:hypothetical protein n=1 Tax=Mycobacterium colombiense TaxID=339268 RepID=UPI0007EDAD53|nr:hypothetical protein [Mycobacterium colombiense]OBJ36417.1 hypothetical protein A5620_01680 [Mycobacterium colombiense]
MTGPHSEAEGPGTRPISVAELLARNGTIGAPAVTRRRRRRRGDSDSVTVAELTGDLPVIRDDDDEPARNANEATDTIDAVDAAPPAREAAAEPVTKAEPRAPYWSEPEPRWPKSPPQPKRAPGPERSEYPRPLPEAGPSGSSANGTGQGGSGAEDMSFDPLDHYADVPVDVMDSEVREAEPALEDSAYVRSFLRSGDDEDDEDGSGPLPAGVLGDDHLGLEDREADAAADARPEQGRFDAVWRGGVVVLQSMLAVAFGGGLFVAFDQLWRWNSLVALVLSVLVILGLVAGVRVVRKTEDIASTLIAVAVGALITLGPLALSLQSG